MFDEMHANDAIIVQNFLKGDLKGECYLFSI